MLVQTVKRNADVMSSTEIKAYRELMGERGLRMAPDRRDIQPDGKVNLRTDPNRLCLWTEQDDAQSFCDELTKRTGADWVVEALEVDSIDEDQVN